LGCGRGGGGERRGGEERGGEGGGGGRRGGVGGGGVGVVFVGARGVVGVFVLLGGTGAHPPQKPHPQLSCARDKKRRKRDHTKTHCPPQHGRRTPEAQAMSQPPQGEGVTRSVVGAKKKETSKIRSWTDNETKGGRRGATIIQESMEKEEKKKEASEKNGKKTIQAQGTQKNLDGK